MNKNFQMPLPILERLKIVELQRIKKLGLYFLFYLFKVLIYNFSLKDTGILIF